MHTYARVKQDDGKYLFVVGCWVPPAYNEGDKWKWSPLVDCSDARDAMSWVNYLNGGTGNRKEKS